MENYYYLGKESKEKILWDDANKPYIKEESKRCTQNWKYKSTRMMMSLYVLKH